MSKRRSLGMTDGVYIPDTIKNQQLKWDELIETRNLALNAYSMCAEFIMTIYNNYPDTIAKDSELMTIIQGSIKTLTDISKRLLDNSKLHATCNNWNAPIPELIFKRGPININNTNAEMQYINIVSQYLSATERINVLTSAVVTEVSTKLNLDKDGTVVNSLKEVHDNAVATINNIYTSRNE